MIVIILFIIQIKQISFYNIGEEYEVLMSSMPKTQKLLEENEPDYLVTINNENYQYFKKLKHTKMFKYNKNIIIHVHEEIPVELTQFIIDISRNMKQHAETMSEPNINKQYFINNTGQQSGIPGEDLNILGAWNKGYTGFDNTVTIVDQGCFDHLSYRNRYLNEISSSISTKCAKHNYTQDSSCIGARPTNTTDTHGTSCASLSVGSQEHACGSGIAYKSKLSCIALKEMNKMDVSVVIDSILRNYTNSTIKSNSWGFSCVPFNNFAICPTHPQSSPYNDALSLVSTKGRDGNGMISIFAAGNEGNIGSDTSNSFLTREMHNIVVAASTNKGTHAFYSTPGNSILVNAPSGGMSEQTPVSFKFPGVATSSGPGENQCTPGFTGTSAATPMVSGVVSLIIEANQNLTWRDVQAILAITATRNDPKSITWKQNKAGYWFSRAYGFGRVDAGLAVEMAENWTNLPPQSKAATGVNESEHKIQTCRSEPTIINISVNSNEIEFIEFVDLQFSLSAYDPYSLLVIKLVSPSGTEATIKRQSVNAPIENMSPFYFGIRDFFGENANGTWTLIIINLGCVAEVTIKDVKLHAHGFNGFEMPKLESKIGKNHQDVDNSTPSLSVNIGVKEAKCYSPIPLQIISTLGNNKPVSSSVFFKNVANNQTLFFGMMQLTSSAVYNASIPCLFADNTKIQVVIEIPEMNIKATSNIINLRAESSIEKIILPEPYQVIRTSTKASTAVHIRWQMLMKELPPSFWDSTVMISIVDSTKTKMPLFMAAQNIANLSIILPPNAQCTQCIIVVSPSFHENISSCHTLVQPVRIISSRSAIPSVFEVDFSSYCPHGIPLNKPLFGNRFGWLLILGIFLTILLTIQIIHERRSDLQNQDQNQNQNQNQSQNRNQPVEP